ncbi:MAG: type II toxin-antitoxin system VapC family toxin [Pyrinomonadaceae bacterium]
MTKFTFDTSFIISNKLSVVPDNFLYSDIVLLELIRGAKDETNFKKHLAAREQVLKDNLLIIPNSDDWLMAGKVLYWIEQGKKKANQGNAPKKRPGETRKMVMDALIAISARRYNTTVVTDNLSDFAAIKYYCDFKLISGADFLEKYG